MLELRNVTKRYPATTAVKDVSFVARRGEVTGYLGPNGSGKSTTLKMITGLIEPTEGEILFDGERIQRDPMRLPPAPRLRPRRAAALSAPHGRRVSRDGRPVARRAGAARSRDKIDGFLRLLSLHGDRYVPISSYSKGMRQKVLLAAALLHNPDLVLLDEPFSGLDVNSALVLRELIRELAARGKAVIFSSHELETVERVSARVIILHKGRVVANDSIEQLRTLMSLPTLEGIFAQLAVEQDTAGITRQFLECMEA